MALIGVSLDQSKFGGRVLRNLVTSGFRGKVHAVHPRATELMGVPCVPTLSRVPGPVDVLVIALPRERVGEVLAEAPVIGAKGAIIFSSGYAETGPDGERLQAELADLGRRAGVRLMGPNCLGLYNAQARVALSANEVLNRGLRPGPVAVVSQSGALVGSILDRGEDVGVHFAGFASTGNEADLDAAHFAEAFIEDPEVKVLLAYLEGVRSWERFGTALDLAAAADKPVIVVKAGRTADGRRAVRSHTGSLAGDAAVFDCFCEAKGAVLARDMDEALDIALAFTQTRPVQKPAVRMVSISGGLAGLAADRAEEFGLELPAFSAATVAALKKTLPGFATPQNPLDVTGAVTSSPGLLEECLVSVAADDSGGLVLLLLTVVFGHEQLAAQILRARDRTGAPFLAVWSGGRLLRPSVESLKHGGVATYDTLGRALPVARALLSRAARGAAARRPRQSPFDDDQLERARRALASAGRGGLTEYESKRILSTLGFPVPRERLARTREEAVRCADEITYPVAIKVMSRDIPHKTAAGGVALGVGSREEAQRRTAEILERCAAAMPHAMIDGVLVQEMAPPGREAIIGAFRRPGVGPLVMVGLGGVDVEGVRDVTFRLAPVDAVEAAEMVRELRTGRLFSAGDQPAAALVDALVRVSWAVSELPTIAELDINPLLLDSSGVGLVLDALITIEDPAPGKEPQC